jgi:chemotaxis protein methyltransferase CheR
VIRRFGSDAGAPHLSADEYRLLRDLVSERVGISFGPDARGSLERRLRERLAVHGLTSFGDYYQLLKYGLLAAEEWEEAAELLTIHETYFLREDYQLRAFESEILPMLAEQGKGRRRLQVWSAGCSTGEEAYTIAMLILDSGLFSDETHAPRDGWELRVYGSDVSKRCITAARRGIYARASFRSAAANRLRAKWFIPEASDGAGAETYSVVSEVRRLCQFGQMNLLDEERSHLVGRCDVIFCRNVLMYFDAPSRRRVIEMLHERLVPGGILLLGHAESLLNVSTAFELLHLREDLVYRKPMAASGTATR